MPKSSLSTTNRAALLRSPAFLGHETGGHPENPRRLVAIDAELERQGLIEGRVEVAFAAADRAAVERVHDPRYLDLLERVTKRGGAWLDPDTMIGPDSYEVACLAAGAAVAAVNAALDGVAHRSFVLGRPPGHHATRARGMGFCLINTVAVAASQALARGLDRVAIVDWDVHHGNGTQDIFYDSNRVLSCSVHQSPFYPGTGSAQETGAGAGWGCTINVPLAAGQGDAVFAGVFDEIFLPRIREFRPELLLISASFDAHQADPIGGMRLTETGFAALAERVVGVADECAEGRVVAVLEGGYDPLALARSVAAVLRVLDGNAPGEYDEHNTRPERAPHEQETDRRP
ncbi:MAG: histone deacetylase family protein [Thermomicrobiales bacterium]